MAKAMLTAKEGSKGQMGGSGGADARHRTAETPEGTPRLCALRANSALLKACASGAVAALFPQLAGDSTTMLRS